jgi:hypothetical protein
MVKKDLQLELDNFSKNLNIWFGLKISKIRNMPYVDSTKGIIYDDGFFSKILKTLKFLKSKYFVNW